MPRNITTARSGNQDDKKSNIGNPSGRRKVFGSPTGGKYFVQEFENEEPRGGSFFKTIQEAERHMVEYENGGDSDDLQFLAE